MAAAIAIQKQELKFKTVEEFEAYVSDKSQFADKRFEFTNGKIIEKSGLKQEEFFIAQFLMRLFSLTAHYKRGDALITESDSHIDSKRKRIADLGYFTKEQIQQARKGKKFASSFVIEIMSPNDKASEIEDKILDYFDSDVQLVWYISPTQKQIYVYTSPIDVKIYKDETLINAEPVLSDFSFKIKDMFVS